MAQFDAMLLKEQQEVAAKRAEQGAGAATGGGQGEGGEGEGGGGSGGGSSGSQAGGAKTSTAQARGGRGQDKNAGTTDRSTGSSESGGGGGGRAVATDPEGTPPQPVDRSRIPADVGDGRGDDVVARQLREAAISEEDPKIREKLWEEYRRYKRGES